jgi:hypothetical protein
MGLGRPPARLPLSCPPPAPNLDYLNGYLTDFAGAVCAAIATGLAATAGTTLGCIGMALLPAAEDLKGLLLRMTVALGARCALRVRRLYWGGRQDALSLDEAIHAAEKLFDSRRPVCSGPYSKAAPDSVLEVARRRAVDTVRHVALSYAAAAHLCSGLERR